MSYGIWSQGKLKEQFIQLENMTAKTYHQHHHPDIW